jgi:zinc/manganese transport system permease protein
MNIDALSLGILGPAFIAGLLVLATHVPLGQQVLQRGIVFIDLAVAQVAALGLLAADMFGWEPQGWQMQAVATGAALLAALLLTWMERRWPEVQEALIGAMFVLAASAALMLLAHNPHGGEHLQELLAGQILWVTWDDLVPLGLVTLALCVAWFGFRHKLGRIGFYGMFAVAVTASVQLVGVYLVFSSLILPALAVRHWPVQRRLAGAWSIGAVAYALGLAASALFDLPSGAVIVWALALTGLAANLACPRVVYRQRQIF